jgi:hypothetical protein
MCNTLYKVVLRLHCKNSHGKDIILKQQNNLLGRFCSAILPCVFARLEIMCENASLNWPVFVGVINQQKALSSTFKNEIYEYIYSGPVFTKHIILVI